MKNIFKAILLTLSLCFVFSAQAQIKYGVKAGFSGSNMSGADELLGYAGSSFDDKAKLKPGFHAGGIMQLEFEQSFFLQSELLFSNQGLTAKSGNKSKSFNVNYLQLPVYVGFKIKTGTSLDILLGAGPYFALGLNGSDDPISFGGDDSKLNRFDMGIALLGGVQYNKFQFTLGYDFGLIDAFDIDSQKQLQLQLSSVYNRNLKVSVGYFF